MWPFLLALPARAEPCADLSPTLDRIEAAIAELRFPEAHAAISSAETSLGCGSVVDPLLLGRLWRAEGVLASFERDADASDQALAAAARVAPSAWTTAFGEPLHQRMLALAAVDTGSAELRLSPSGDGLFTAVDGRESTFPATVPAGLHLVQVGASPQQIAFGRIVLASAGDALTVTHGVVPLPIPKVVPVAVAPVPAAPPEPMRRGLPPAVRIGAPVLAGAGTLALGVLSGATFGRSLSAYHEYTAEVDDATADGIWADRVAPSRNAALAEAGGALALAGGTVVIAVALGPGH